VPEAGETKDGNMATTVQWKLIESKRIAGLACMAMAFAVTHFAGRQASAQSAPIAYPVPFVTAIAGNGAAGVTTCVTGCAASTAGLDAPQGAAVDSYGNVYIADYSDKLVRVIYSGGSALASAIVAANSGFTVTGQTPAPTLPLVVGDIYTLAGLGGTLTALTAVSTDGTGKFACGNNAVSGQPDALNSLGDGCPAASAVVAARDVAVDAAGNLFITDYSNARIRVLCVSCTSSSLAAQLIELEEPGVTPVNGAMYTIAGYAAGYRDAALGFGNVTTAATSVALLRSPTAAVVSSSDDVFIADNLNNAVRVLYNGGAVAKNILLADGYTPVQGYVYTIAGDDCVSAAATKTGSVATANACLVTSPASATPATTADTAAPEVYNATATTGPPVSVAWTVYLDPNGNVYYTDAGNARIKVIYGGVAAPITFPTTAYPASSLKTGYVYTFAGQGALTQSGVAPSQLVLSSAQGVGGDANGNVFFADYATGLLYETYAQNGLTAIIGGNNAITTAAANADCNGGTTGPVMGDAFYDGCPLTQAKLGSPRGPIVADASGNLYFGDSPGSLLRKFSYSPAYPTTAVGANSAAQSYAFTFSAAKTLGATTFPVEGGTAAGFSDAGGDTCTSGLVTIGTGTPTTCVVNAYFSPARPGLIAGAVVLNSTTGVLGASTVSGTGTGAGLAIDPGTVTVTGTGLAPSGIAVDGGGRVYVADATTKSVLRYSGGTASTIAGGFTAPAGVAVDGPGNVYIADSSANTITLVPITGTKFVLTSAVSAPHGMATDGLGDLFVADSGNNRIIKFGPGATLFTMAAFAGLSAPQAVAADAGGNVYAADSTHVVKLSAAGVQTTIAASGATGLVVDAAGNVLATNGTTLTEYPAAGTASVPLYTSLTTPKALALDSAGNAYIADATLAGYLELQRTAGYYQFASSPSSTTVYLSSIGTASLSAPTNTQTDTTDFSLVAATTNGCSGAIVTGTACALTAGFNPMVPTTVADTVTYTSNAVNAATLTLTLTGTAGAQATTTAVKSSPAALVYGNAETLTATVSGTLTAPSMGSVNFYNGTTLLGSGNVGVGGVATLAFVPPVGSYTVSATFVPSTTGLAFQASTSTASAGFSVTPATLTVTATSVSRFYNTANPTLTYTITGFVNNDAQTVVSGTPSESTTATMSSSTGTYAITITQGSLSAANYAFSFVNGTLTITGATAQSLSFGALPGVTYGVAPIALTATASSGLTPTYTVTGPASVSGATLSVTGAGQICVTANQGGSNVYAAATSVTQCFNAAKAVLSVTAISVSRTYGAANPTLTSTITGFVNSDTQVTATSGAPAESTTAAATSSVGGYAITIALGTLTSTNYTFNTPVNGTLTVTAATLTLTAANVARVYGAANPAFTGTLSGAVNGDVLTETFSTTASVASAPGPYSIVPSATGANLADYTLSATNGTLTVNQALPLVVLSTTATSGYANYTSITLTATASSPTSGTPSQTVTFMAGTTAVGSATLASGTATLTTNTLPVGVDSITAVYGGDTDFAAGTSNGIAITIAPGYATAPSATTIAFQPGYQEAQAILTITPGGRQDTLTFACQGLPARLSCTFSPPTLPLAGLTATQAVELLVSDSNATASMRGAPRLSAQRTVALALLPMSALLLWSMRRRRVRALLMLLVALCGAATLSGCGTSAGNQGQGAGTYPFTVTINSGTTTLTTLPFTLTIP
jgi:hypothetical protein